MGGNLKEVFTLAFLIILVEFPWFILSVIIVKDKLRIKKSLCIGLLTGILAIYAIFIISVSMGVHKINAYLFVLMFYMIMIAFLMYAVKLFWGKILYIFFLFKSLTYMTGSISYMISQRMLGADTVISFRNTPQYPVLFIFFNAIVIFLLLRFFIKPLMAILDDINKRSTLYLCIAPFLFFIVQEIMMRIHHTNAYENTHIIILHLFLIFTGITTYISNLLTVHETSKRIWMEAQHQFAMNVISTGRDHYQKMNEQFDALRIMKHDYKFHLNTALGMLQNGDFEESRKYLNGLQTQLEEKELQKYCDNQVINALVNDYNRRCRELNIQFDVSITFTGDYTIPNYEMCIVLGNLHYCYIAERQFIKRFFTNRE